MFGKAGRADTSTDPAPFSMVETTVTLKPESQWRTVKRWYSNWPQPFRSLFSYFVPEHLTFQELQDAHEPEAGVFQASDNRIWPIRIKNRIDMLSTGVRTPIGIKVLGPELKVVQKIGEDLENIKSVTFAAPARFWPGHRRWIYLDFVLKRDELARYGLNVQDAQEIIMSAVGGENVTTTIEGLERTASTCAMRATSVTTWKNSSACWCPPRPCAHSPGRAWPTSGCREGPSMIRNENGQLAGYVFVDMVGRDMGGYVEEAKKTCSSRISKCPRAIPSSRAASTRIWPGLRNGLKKSFAVDRFSDRTAPVREHQIGIKVGMVMLAVPFSLVGAVWLLYLLHYNISMAGVGWNDRADGIGRGDRWVPWLLFLDLAYEERVRKGQMRAYKDLEEAIVQGAVKRIRPKMMTVTAMFMGLLPIMWSLGAGADNDQARCRADGGRRVYFLHSRNCSSIRSLIPYGNGARK